MVEAAVAKRTTPEPEDAARDELIAVRCTAAYKKWVKDFAKDELVTPTQLVAIALKALAETKHFRKPPAR